jgi:pyruvate-ferredoxin/flavodoxin oxidoreductase
MQRRMITIDGNEAASRVAYATSEIIAIYPITPASPMGEWADEWAHAGTKNLWGSVPTVVEMQSEAGAAGTLHGALQAGSLATTFTASQGLLLMIPNMFKMAGELTPAVIHVAARTVATHALSIFGDHGDVMACRGTGFALLASSSVQEAMDLALVAGAGSLRSRIPFVHFFDGFRTSHEIAKIEEVTADDMRAMIDDDLVHLHRTRALSPEHPVIRGTAQNPDVFFQAREAANPFYDACPAIVEAEMRRLAAISGRRYGLFDYVGDPRAARVIVIMGSGAEAVEETVERLNRRGECVGLVKVRLYRPFSVAHFAAALPPTVRSIAVLDRTKEPGATGEPLYVDVVTAVDEAMASGRAPFATRPVIVGGRYGLSSKEFTPAMVKAVYDMLAEPRPRNHFTVGIVDDVTHASLAYDAELSCEVPDVVRAVFYGLGSDGTVSANKSSIKIIGEGPLFAQGYFVYDSKKAGAMTVSHLRFGPRPIHSSYLIREAQFVACHHFALLGRVDVLSVAASAAVVLLNSPYSADDTWAHLPASVQETIIEKRLRLYVIDANRVAASTGMGRRINTIMQTCFFALSGVLPREEAVAAIKQSIRKSYGKRGEEVVRQNFDAVDQALAHLHECPVPDSVTGLDEHPAFVSQAAPDFVQRVTARILAGQGDSLPVSAFPADGTFPSGTSQWEKRNLATEIPAWDEQLCIQCGKCVLVCPHAAVRAKVYEPSYLESAPLGFKSAKPLWKGLEGRRYSLQVAPEDCTGCSLCVEACPAHGKSDPQHKALAMIAQAPIRDDERAKWAFFLGLPGMRDPLLPGGLVKRTQLLQPLFEFSGACAGCGETPYLRLLTQLFGDRAVIANATGCSSIYGGNLPTTPYTMNREGRGPAWANSLFEDNAEFGLGIRLAIDEQGRAAAALVDRLRPEIGDDLANGLLHADQSSESGVAGQRARVAALQAALKDRHDVPARDLAALAGSLIRKSVWIVGGDGWAYDIGFGGLDHVLASGQNVRVLVLDTEVYSNTGGQRSKATPRGAVARFAAGGKETGKKDLALMATSYGNVYVARVAMGANDTQTVQAFEEAEAHDGPALIVAFAPCIAHGYDLARSLEHQKQAVQSAYWPLFRFDPARIQKGENPFTLDSRPPSTSLADYFATESRFDRIAHAGSPDDRELLREAEADVSARWQLYAQLAAMRPGRPS